MKRLRAWQLLVAIILTAGIIEQSSAADVDVALTDDLRTVIVLAGYPCNTVTGYSKPNQTDYRVSCDMDRIYLVSISEEKELVVIDKSSTPQDVSRTGTEHEEFMKRQLSAIVNLSGHECVRVLSFERRGPKDNLVTCHDLSVYRIHVTPEGRVAVDRQSVEK
jgi:hypothetical protein